MSGVIVVLAGLAGLIWYLVVRVKRRNKTEESGQIEENTVVNSQEREVETVVLQGSEKSAGG